MSRLPKSIKVGPYRYAVRVDDATVDKEAGGRDLYAITRTGVHEIVFRKNTEDLQATLLHEVLHAVWALSGLDGRWESHPTEEDAIETLDSLLLAVLQENPSLVSYLTAAGG